MTNGADGRVWAIVPAAGIGERMASDCPKQYLELGGRSILEHALRRLAGHPRVRGVLPVIREGDPFWPGVCRRLGDLARLLPEVPGGASRQDSVGQGIAGLEPLAPDDLVLIHDAVRPCLGEAEIDAVIDAAREGHGSILAVPVADTLKRVTDDRRIEATVDRSQLWRAQTPQVFPAGPLKAALDRARQREWPATDEASIMEAAGYTVRIAPGREDNLKITRPEDLSIARAVLESRWSG